MDNKLQAKIYKCCWTASRAWRCFGDWLLWINSCSPVFINVHGYNHGNNYKGWGCIYYSCFRKSWPDRFLHERNKIKIKNSNLVPKPPHFHNPNEREPKPPAFSCTGMLLPPGVSFRCDPGWKNLLFNPLIPLRMHGRNFSEISGLSFMSSTTGLIPSKQQHWLGSVNRKFAGFTIVTIRHGVFRRNETRPLPHFSRIYVTQSSLWSFTIQFQRAHCWWRPNFWDPYFFIFLFFYSLRTPVDNFFEISDNINVERININVERTNINVTPDKTSNPLFRTRGPLSRN